MNGNRVIFERPALQLTTPLAVGWSVPPGLICRRRSLRPIYKHNTQRPRRSRLRGPLPELSALAAAPNCNTVSACRCLQRRRRAVVSDEGRTRADLAASSSGADFGNVGGLVAGSGGRKSLSGIQRRNSRKKSCPPEADDLLLTLYYSDVL